MGTNLQQTLRSLCFKTEWKYAVFWKLKHRARMVLTWEDAYYDNHEQDPLESTCFTNTLQSFHDGHYLQDPLGLALAKMSYLVYSLGEGTIGQVAVSGKHQWILADNPASNSWSPTEFHDGWQPQFSAGIKTVAVVAVVPHGVVQLGSLNVMNEDSTLVNHVKDAFCLLQNSCGSFLPNPMQCTIKNDLYPPEVSSRSLCLDALHDCVDRSDTGIKNKKSDILSHFLPLLGNHNNMSCCILPLTGIHQRNVAEVVNKHGGLKSPAWRVIESDELLHLRPEIFNFEQSKQLMKVSNDKKCGQETGGMGEGSEQDDVPPSHSFLAENTNLCNVILPSDKSAVTDAYIPSDLLDSAIRDRIRLDKVVNCENGVLKVHKPLEMLDKCLEQKQEIPTTDSFMDTINACFHFSGGCELHEALGSVSQKVEVCSDWSEVNTEAGTTFELSEGIANSHHMSDSGSEYLLEAVVAKVLQGSSNITSENSFCESAQSLLTTEKMPQAPMQTKHASCPEGSLGQSLAVEDDTQKFLNSSWGSVELFGVRSPKELSSTTRSTCSEQLERRVEPAKTNRKRARPGESCRPRPRDRQLIQDRVKELRELVPNGSKCSIDSLLERTIKHMLFLQSVTKHADKLKKCAESKMLNKEVGLLGSSCHEHGSSWALGVGNDTKFCPRIVENLDRNGQMLVEMFCEECSNFLEVAEAIRGLGLTILKGVMETHAEKTWVCFVVEVQNNRGMQRMDILLPLMQLLQAKTKI